MIIGHEEPHLSFCLAHSKNNLLLKTGCGAERVWNEGLQKIMEILGDNRYLDCRGFIFAYVCQT